MTEYERGFTEKCAELGIDPGELVNAAGFWDTLSGIGGYVAGLPARIGERVGNDYAAWRAEHPAPLSVEEQNRMLRGQIGYANRTLRNYRRAAGLPAGPRIQVPRHIMPNARQRQMFPLIGNAIRPVVNPAGAAGTAAQSMGGFGRRLARTFL